jgi:CheY-like chemotaxis protein
VNIDNFVKLLDAVTKLLNVLVWPGILLFILIRFGSPLGDFFSKIIELSFDAFGVNVSVKRQAAEAVAFLSAAAASRAMQADMDSSPKAVSVKANSIADTVASNVNQQLIKIAEKATVLWVDDHPDNNIYERQALEALGIKFVLVRSTKEALDKLRQQQIDVIISDMEREPDQQAAFTLLDESRSIRGKTPFIIYTGSKAQELALEAKNHGAIGCTNSPNDLFEMVLSSIRSKQDYVDIDGVRLAKRKKRRF